MSLEEYRKKRSFEKSPEPSGQDATASDQFRFVIQKHQATNLHYDLRLELDGVLKSWAVPKGPSLDPADKRLAIHVEDHPIEYLHFEGVIPKGEYGGGTVMVWDTGTWEPVASDKASDGYASGDLKFRLHGHKLQGQWMLVHTGKRKKDKSLQRHWLFFKERDGSARPKSSEDSIDVLEAFPDSVLSTRSLEQISQAADAVWSAKDTQSAKKLMPSHSGGTGTKPTSAKRRRGKPHKRSKKAAMPTEVAAALPTATRKPPRGEEWQHEIKFDGYRMLALVNDRDVRFLSRNAKDWTDRLSRMAVRLQRIAASCVLDGEIVFMASDGTTSFQSLQNTIGRGDDRALSYCVFDLLHLDGYDLTKVPLEDRRALLAELIKAAADPALIFSEHLDADGQLVFEKAAQLGAEGIVSKRKVSAYIGGRTDNWVKTKCLQTAEFVVGGYTPSTANRRALGALVVGRYEDGNLHYEGRVGTGFSAQTQVALLDALQTIEIDESPFCDLTGHDLKTLRPVEPNMVVELEYGGWTDQRRLRFPSYRGLREDRNANEITRCGSQPPEATRVPAATLRAMERTRLTHADRVMFPESGITKLGLATYYAEVAEHMLPMVADRPLAVIRYPKGLGEKSFFQKSLPKGMPETVRALGGEKHKAMVIKDVAGLLALVQFSALEIHIWGSRADRPQKPDRIVFDLDPDSSVPFTRVGEAAMTIRKVLEAIDLRSFVMTTGGKGLHVVAPIRRTSSWDDVKNFSKAVAAKLVKQSPGRFTTSPSKSARSGKIYIDVLRNSAGATAIAPFSTRAKESASIATPITWAESQVLSSASVFTITNFRRRLDGQSATTGSADPWSDYFETKQSLTAAKIKHML